MKAWQRISLAVLMGAVVVSPVAAQSQQTWSFSGIDRIDLDGTEGASAGSWRFPLRRS